MRAVLKVSMLLIFLTTVGCENFDEDLYRQKQEEIQSKCIPLKITEKDGVTVWKVEDKTPGGKGYVYFTSPSQNGLIINPD